MYSIYCPKGLSLNIPTVSLIFSLFYIVTWNRSFRFRSGSPPSFISAAPSPGGSIFPPGDGISSSPKPVDRVAAAENSNTYFFPLPAPPSWPSLSASRPRAHPPSAPREGGVLQLLPIVATFTDSPSSVRLSSSCRRCSPARWD